MGNKKTVVLEKKEKEVYLLSIHGGRRSPNSVSFDSEIRQLDEKPVQGHYLVERYHYLGGGMGGWDSYSEKVGIANCKKELSSKIYQCAVEQGKKLARRVHSEFIDKTN